MRSRIALLAAAALLVAALAGCGGQSGDDARLRVVATTTQIADRAREAVEARVGPVDGAHLVAAAALMRERLTFARDLAEATYLFAEPETYEEAGVRKRWKAESARLVRAYAERIAAVEAFDAASLETALRALAEAEGVGAGQIVHPVRLAVTGVTTGAGLFEMMEVLGRDACLRRLERAASVLG